MAWLQNLAGKAENFLNKIDQNAATVLNESTNKSENDNASIIIEPSNDIPDPGYDYTDHNNAPADTVAISNNLMQVQSQNLIDEDIICDNVSIKSAKSRISDNDSVIINPSRDSTSPFENVVALQISEGDSITESLQYCQQIPEDLHAKYEEKITNLELSNQNLNKELLNLHHIYRELQNDNNNLQMQVERANICVKQAQEEMEHYKIRAQRVLQEKAAQKESINNSLDIDNSAITSYNEELKKEIEFHHDKNRDLTERLNNLTTDFMTLQQQYVFLQNSSEENKQRMSDNLAHEKKCRSIADEECKIKTKDLQSALFKISDQEAIMKKQDNSIENLKQQLKQRKQFTANEEVESRFQSLTQMLMTKQSNLEAITTERNALRIQLEKLEIEYRKTLQVQKTQVNISNNDDNGELGGRTNVPKLMVVSPFDVGMTRRVKQTYSTLDALSIRSGVFLRRYPLARIFVFCYMILLHIWVLIILCTYIPTSR